MTESEDLSGLLALARSLGQVRGEAADALNRSFGALEHQLADLRLGAGGEVVLYTDEAGAEFLGFRKWGDRWRLVTEYSASPPNDNLDKTELLVSAPIEVRLRAAERLSALVKSMIDAAKQDVDSIVAATGRTIALAESIQSSMQPPQLPGSTEPTGIQALAALGALQPTAPARTTSESVNITVVDNHGGLSTGSGSGSGRVNRKGGAR